MTVINLPSGQTVYDPRGVVDVNPQSLAPRLESLAGVRIGVLDNSKWNAGRLLRRTVSLLEASDGPFEEVRFYKKASFSSNAAPELVEEIVSEVDVVVTAVGD